MAENPSARDVLALTTEIVTAHIAHNSVAVGDLSPHALRSDSK